MGDAPYYFSFSDRNPTRGEGKTMYVTWMDDWLRVCFACFPAETFLEKESRPVPLGRLTPHKVTVSNCSPWVAIVGVALPRIAVEKSQSIGLFTMNTIVVVPSSLHAINFRG